jgi:hypothetical protein
MTMCIWITWCRAAGPRRRDRSMPCKLSVRPSGLKYLVQNNAAHLESGSDSESSESSGLVLRDSVCSRPARLWARARRGAGLWLGVGAQPVLARRLWAGQNVQRLRPPSGLGCLRAEEPPASEARAGDVRICTSRGEEGGAAMRGAAGRCWLRRDIPVLAPPGHSRAKYNNSIVTILLL